MTIKLGKHEFAKTSYRYGTGESSLGSIEV